MAVERQRAERHIPKAKLCAMSNNPPPRCHYLHLRSCPFCSSCPVASIWFRMATLNFLFTFLFQFPVANWLDHSKFISKFSKEGSPFHERPRKYYSCWSTSGFNGLKTGVYLGPINWQGEGQSDCAIQMVLDQTGLSQGMQ